MGSRVKGMSLRMGRKPFVKEYRNKFHFGPNFIQFHLHLKLACRMIFPLIYIEFALQHQAIETLKQLNIIKNIYERSLLIILL